MQISNRKVILRDTTEISQIWKIVCAGKRFSLVNSPYSPEQKSNWFLTPSYIESVILAEIKNKIGGFQPFNLLSKYTDSIDHVGVLPTFTLPNRRKIDIGSLMTIKSFDY